MKYHDWTQLKIYGWMALIAVLFLIAATAEAGYRSDKAEATAKQHQSQQQQVSNKQSQYSKAASESVSSASSGGNTQEVGLSSSTENNSTNVVLVPNNNTESCLRVWGIMFGNSSASGGIGVPTRSKACDYEQAGDDAAAAGDHNLAWYWRCHKRALYKPFKTNGLNKQGAIVGCFEKMTDFADNRLLLTRINELQQALEDSIAQGLVCDEATQRCTQTFLGQQK